MNIFPFTFIIIVISIHIFDQFCSIQNMAAPIKSMTFHSGNFEQKTDLLLPKLNLNFRKPRTHAHQSEFYNITDTLSPANQGTNLITESHRCEYISRQIWPTNAKFSQFRPGEIIPEKLSNSLCASSNFCPPRSPWSIRCETRHVVRRNTAISGVVLFYP